MPTIPYHSHIPYTQAYVDPSAPYHDAKVRKWLESPEAVEERFTDYHGPSVMDDYLELFQEDLIRLHQEIDGDDKGVRRMFSMMTQIFYVQLYVDTIASSESSPGIIVLKEVFMRPCAQNHRFFKLILFQLVRSCLAHKCNFLVENPFDAMRNILEKAFGAEKLVYREGNGKEKSNYLIVHYSDLDISELASRLHLVKQEEEETCQDFGGKERTYPIIMMPSSSSSNPSLSLDSLPIQCNPSFFPTSQVLNYGPWPVSPSLFSSEQSPPSNPNPAEIFEGGGGKKRKRISYQPVIRHFKQ